MVADTTYYDTLEVSVTATSTEIKKAYKRLCLIHHPDKQSQQSNSTDSTKFQSIQQAYETLSDQQKRMEYDEFGLPGTRSSGGGQYHHNMHEEFMDDIFQDFFGGGPGMSGSRSGAKPTKPQKRKGPGKPSQAQIFVRLEEMYKGATKSIALERTRSCSLCKGTGAKARAQRRTCVRCRGQGFTTVMRHMGPFMSRSQELCPQCDGEGHVYRDQDACKKCQGNKTVKEKKKLEVHVPRGSIDGEKVVLHGEGDESTDATEPGDLHITLVALPHQTFTLMPPDTYRKDSAWNLKTTLTLTLSESILGFSRLILVHLDGRGLRHTAPAPGDKGWKVFQTGDKLVIKGQGMYRKGSTGDLIVEIKVEQPDEQWAFKLRDIQGGLAKLEELLPSKRSDVENPEETDEVELQELSTANSGSGANGGQEYWTRPETDDEDGANDGAPPGCQQQ
ncbi:hypothetical protein OIO90_002552 [Microbotryomycetes sp. JL221]|nr:hypothetical protein OIO90_002552 [Microbotryomycetes sp. JL221]